MSSDSSQFVFKAKPVSIIATGVSPDDTDAFEGGWTLCIRLDNEYGHCAFDVDEPYLRSYDDWVRLANGSVSELKLYRGNGGGSICVEGEMFVFEGAPSGAGGDVACRFTCPRALVAPCLLEALAAARKEGWAFAPARAHVAKPAAV